MIDFDEELKNYHPKKELSDAEDTIRGQDFTDMIDILKEMTRQKIRTSAGNADRTAGRRNGNG